MDIVTANSGGALSDQEAVDDLGKLESVTDAEEEIRRETQNTINRREQILMAVGSEFGDLAG